MLQGKDLILSIDIPNVGTRAIAAAKSCDFELSTDFIGICAPHGSGGWKHNKPTTLSWSVSSSNLVADQSDVETLMDLQIAKTPLLLRFYDCELKTYRKGYAYIASIKESGSKGDLVSLSISFTPAGALEKAGWESVMVNTTNLSNRTIDINRSTLYGVRISIDNVVVEQQEYIVYKQVHYDTPVRMKLSCGSGEKIIVIKGTAIPNPMYILTGDEVPLYLYPTATYPATTIEGVLPAGDYIVIRNKTLVMPLDIKAEILR